MVNKLATKMVKVHYTKQSRNKFTLFYSLIILCLLVLFIASALMLSFSVNFNITKDDFKPDYNATINQPILFGFGIVVFLIAFGLAVYLAFLIPAIYKTSRMMYFETDKYKKLVRKYEDTDLTKFSNKKNKWLFKLGYISKADYISTKEKNKKNKK